MATKALTYKIGADLGELRRKMEEHGELTRKQKKELRELEQQQRANRDSMSDLGASMLTFGAAAVLGLGMAAREAIKWESAFTGVKKTVDGTDEEIAALEGELRNLAKTLPATHEEIAAVAEAAGQLGIKRKDIAEFTETMVALGETTNLTADEAATALAQFMNIMGTSSEDVDKLGSALVALGNAGASTEKDILEMGLRIAGAGRQVGLSEDQVLAFASALASVGINAEAGGSSFSRVMVSIAAAVQDGGQDMESFAAISGMSGEKFKKTWEQDASQAIIAFIQGLGRMQTSGGNVLGVLEELGFTEILVRDALLRAAGASDMFTASLKTGSRGWIENSALAEEAAKRYATTESQIAVAGNAIKDALIDIGAVLLPIVQGGIEVIRNLVTWFQNLPGPVQTAVTILGAVTAAVTVLGGAAMIAAPKILAFRESMSNMVATGSALPSALGKFGLFMTGPWAAAIGVGITLLSAFAASSGGAQVQQQELADAGKSVAQAIKEQNGVINDAVRKTAAKQAADKGMLSAARDLGIDLETVTDAILGQGEAYDQLTGKLQSHIDMLNQEMAATDDQSGVAHARIQGEIDQYQLLLDGIKGMNQGKDEELQKEKDVAAATGQTTEELRGQEGATTDLGIAADKATDALDAMIDALDRLNGVTLSHREAQRNLVQAVNDANAVFKDNSKTLNIHTEDGMENQEALDGIASSMNDAAEAAAREAEATGGAAAGQAALKASLESSRQQLFDVSKQFFDTEEAAWDYVDSVLAIPPEAKTELTTPGSQEAQNELARVRDKVHDIPPGKEVNVGVLSSEAIGKLEALGFKVNTLPDGTVAVTAQTSAAQGALDSFIDRNIGRQIPIKINLQGGGTVNQIGGRIFISQARGGIVHSYANGGIENHRPEIARARRGTVRIWAEDETERESYIPWAMDRRGAATSVLRETADGFGFALVPKSSLVRSFAQGGVTGSGGGSGDLAGCTVQVFIGDRELTDIVDVRITENTRRTVRHVTAGSGNTR